jgi:hypothetical protein
LENADPKKHSASVRGKGLQQLDSTEAQKAADSAGSSLVKPPESRDDSGSSNEVQQISPASPVQSAEQLVSENADPKKHCARHGGNGLRQLDSTEVQKPADCAGFSLVKPPDSGIVSSGNSEVIEPLKTLGKGNNVASDHGGQTCADVPGDAIRNSAIRFVKAILNPLYSAEVCPLCNLHMMQNAVKKLIEQMSESIPYTINPKRFPLCTLHALKQLFSYAYGTALRICPVQSS